MLNCQIPEVKRFLARDKAGGPGSWCYRRIGRIDRLSGVTASVSKRGLLLGLLALAALSLSALIFTETIRPFRNSNIDLPIGVAGCVLAAALTSAALCFRQGARVLNWIGLILSLLALLAVAFIYEALSHMRFM